MTFAKNISDKDLVQPQPLGTLFDRVFEVKVCLKTSLKNPSSIKHADQMILRVTITQGDNYLRRFLTYLTYDEKPSWSWNEFQHGICESSIKPAEWVANSSGTDLGDFFTFHLHLFKYSGLKILLFLQ